jgi:N-acetylneuraminic acid mutarotase
MQTSWTAIAACLVLGCGGGGSTAKPDGDPGGMIDSPPGGSCMDTPGWSPAPGVLGGPVQETAAVELAGKIYVIGGFNAAQAIVDKVRVFDTVSCTWSDGATLPRPVHHANAVVVDGTIYVLGALVEGFAAIGDVWAWTPATTPAWVARASMPAGSERGAAVTGAVNGVIYVAGGLRAGAAVAQLSSYTPATDTWKTNLPALPQATDHACGGAVLGKLYVVGGRMGTAASRTNTVYEYTPGGAWATRAPMPTARGGAACGFTEISLIVAGGEGNPNSPLGVFSEVETYDVGLDRWATQPPMLTPRHGVGAAYSGAVFYVPGGASREGFHAVDTHELLHPVPQDQ